MLFQLRFLRLSVSLLFLFSQFKALLFQLEALLHLSVFCHMIVILLEQVIV